MTEVWNSVTIYGLSREIERFKRTCLDPDEEIYRAGQSGWDGCNCTISVPLTHGDDGASSSSDCNDELVWNFQQFTSDTDIEYSFSFDTDFKFPVRLFEELAARFPRLAFDCTCIEAMDDFMGYGWFNAPHGGEGFRQDYEVPDDYWTSGSGQRRDREAEAAHEERVEKLKQAAIGVVSSTR